MTNINITPVQALRIQNSNKDFIIFDTRNDKLTKFILTNDLQRYRKKHKNFRVLNIFKKELTIKL